MRSRQNIIPLPLNLWNARLFIRFIGVLKRLGCIDEYIVSLPDYTFAVHKTLATLLEKDLTDLGEAELNALESNLLSLRNIGLLINREQMKKRDLFFTKQTEKQLNDLIHKIQKMLCFHANLQMSSGLFSEVII